MSGSSADCIDDNEPAVVGPLFQFWDREIPAVVEELTQGVAEINTALDYQFYDDISAAELIREEFGTDTLALYHSCTIPAMRADLFRYCFLVRFGGIYIDADYRGVSSLEPVLTSDWKGCLYKRARGLANGMMFFRHASNPLAQKILDTAIKNISLRASNNVWQVTGPSVLQSIHADATNAAMFEGIHLMEEPEFAQYFKAATLLEYKNNDSHWLVARQKGLSIFRD